ncbi:MAG TPA: hypothetical protein VF594_10490 [Rubricoccaceae bacterium]|jgi:hypothetical protein
MLRSAALLFLCASVGCGPPTREAVAHAVVTGVVVERLPLETAWDGSLSPNPPDIYVDVVDGAPPGPLGYRSVLVRTRVAENVRPDTLPVTLSVSSSVPLSVRAPLRIVVADHDSGGFDDDDDLFVTEIAALASRVGDAAAGDSTSLRFGDGDTRIRVSVRWQ